MAKRRRTCPDCTELRAEVTSLRKVVEQQASLIRELQARLNLTSQNSSKPPSSDAPRAKATRKKGSTGRRRGGQPGAPGKTREPFPPEDVSEFVAVHPSHCSSCGTSLDDGSTNGVPQPRRHQVVEIPPAAAYVIEYVMYHRRCGTCDHTTTAELPDGVEPWAIGPRFQAMLATLTGRFRMSRRETLEAAVALFGPKARLSLGTVTAMEARTRAALTAAYEEAAAAVQGSTIAHPDETSYYEGTHKSWLWVAATPKVAYYRIDPQRGRSAFHRLLPDFEGTIVVDRWNAYLRHPHDKRQLCWAHLKRNFRELVDRGYPATLVGRPGLRAADAVFTAWEDHREGRLTRRGLARRLGSPRSLLRRALSRGRSNGDPKARAMARDLQRQAECLWTFTRIDNVSPHNNLAERLLRPAVLWRKGCFGTQSPSGSRFTETMLTIVQTLRLQQRAVMDFLEQSIRAARHCRTPPRLIPP